MSADLASYNGASSAAIRHHYDVSNDFYALWLDPTLTYSCALWDHSDEPLSVAQVRKLDYLAASAQLPSGARVLDVGCGWGSMLRRLIEQHGAREVVGLNLSQAQVDSIGSWADERYTVRLENWADHEPERPYDAIISIGAFEHFAKYGLTRASRIQAYRAFFARCHAWLPVGSRLVLQTITKGGNNRMTREVVREMLWVIKRIFPDSELPWFSEILEASRGLFEPVHCRNDPMHYALTCRAWHGALLARRADAERVVAADVVEDYLRYLNSCALGFEQRYVSLLRLTLERL